MEYSTLFFESYNETSGRFLVVEEADNSVWAYFTSPNHIKIDKSCFLCSKVEITSFEIDIAALKANGDAPPLTVEYSTRDSYLPTLQVEDISVYWVENESILVSICGNPFLFFIADDSRRGFSKSISKNGFYGNAWDEAKFQEYFQKGEEKQA